MRVMLFTDTLGDVNGVSRFIRNIAAQATETGRSLHVVTSTNFDCPAAPNITNFKPLLAMKMPGYENLELVLPPFLRLLRAARKFRPDAIHISTPGPVGFTGRLAARAMQLPMLGVYHTDFPAYIERLFGNDLFTAVSRTAMRLFYRRFATIFTRSRDYIEALSALGLACDNVVTLRPGIMTQQFQPGLRDEGVWAALQQPHEAASGHASDARAVRVLSVGRVSVEKNLPLLTKVWKQADAALRSRGTAAELVVVGDGPYRAQMEEELAGTRCRFLGFRYGEELSRLYASSDVFVFPSVTDTLGQVVMEAQASGLPVLVTDQGGPKEVVQDGRTGFVLRAHDVDGWVDRIVQLAADEAERQRMGACAHGFMQEYSIARSFEHFWREHEAACGRLTGDGEATPAPNPRHPQPPHTPARARS